MISRRYGVELEFSSNNVNRTTMERLFLLAMEALGNPRHQNRLQNCNHRALSVTESWILKTDGSCGWEVNTPILEGLEGLEKIKTFLRVCSENHNQDLVDNRCGLHIHIDCGDFSRDELQHFIILIDKITPFLESILPRSRRSNSFCSSIEGRNIRYVMGNRTAGFSLAHWIQRGTMEVRYGSGTGNANKAANWILFVHMLLDYSRTIAIPATNLSTPAQFWDHFMSHNEELAGETWAEVRNWTIRRHTELAGNGTRGVYNQARSIRSSRMDRLHQSYHYRIREIMNRDERREHDRMIVGLTEMDHELPDDFLRDFWARNERRRDEVRTYCQAHGNTALLEALDSPEVQVEPDPEGLAARQPLRDRVPSNPEICSRNCESCNREECTRDIDEDEDEDW